MYLIVGLGNPGKEYELTRHNFGFMALDLIGGVDTWDSKHNSLYKKLNDVILVKPQTFMNKSGEAVREFLKYYPDAQLVVVHDDLDFPLGTIKIQKNVSSAGHNGIKSIIESLGTQDFIRVRLGIDSSARGQVPGEDFVLHKFTKDEETTVNEILEQAKQAVDLIQTEKLDLVQSKFNG